MNYRHAFHAGNFADVHKHVLLLGLLELLMRKDSPLCVIDSHAGRGVYDLSQVSAQRSGEFRDGIGRMPEPRRAHHAWVRDYLQAVHRLRQLGSGQTYPGSPALIASRLRAGDRGLLIEREHEECEALRAWARTQNGLAVHERDAYEGIPALTPPPERRGLVLIDPPYEEERDDWKPVQALLLNAWKRWPTGVFALWYPIKHEVQTRRFLRQLAAAGLPRMLSCELCVKPADQALGLNGSGLLMVNPPWTFAQQAQGAQKELWGLLSPEGRGGHRVQEWSSDNKAKESETDKAVAKKPGFRQGPR